LCKASGPERTIPRMFYALLICSDDDCTDSFEAWGSLEELDTLACECGCALELVSLSEAEAGGYAQLALERAA
jgi:hypothetical protein